MPPDATLHGTLYLIPTPLGEGDLARILPAEVRQQVSLLERFIVEHPKTARHFLKQINPLRAIQTLKLEVLDEHTPAGEVEALLAPLLAGEDVGLLSEAGCPAIADPGGTSKENPGGAIRRPFFDFAGIDGFRAEWSAFPFPWLSAGCIGHTK